MATQDNEFKLDFEKINEAGLKRITKMFELHKMPITNITATNKAKRDQTAGALVKTATLEMGDGQKVTFMVKNDGRVFQVKINKTVVPIRNPKDFNRSILDVMDYLDDNTKKFQKAREKQSAALDSIKIPASKLKPPVKTSADEKLTNLKFDVEVNKRAVESLRPEIDGLKRLVETKKAKVIQLQAELKAEQDRTAQLEKQIKEAA